MEMDDRKFAVIFYKIGNKYFDKGKFRKAIWYYNFAIRFDPSNHKPYYNRALAKACLENYDSAIEDFRKVLELENFAECHYVLGLGFECKKMLDDAKKEYREALKLNPEFKDAQNRLEICESQGKTNSINPAKADSDGCREIIEEAKKLEREGRHDKALSKIEEGLRNNPNNIDLLLHACIQHEGHREASERVHVLGRQIQRL